MHVDSGWHPPLLTRHSFTSVGEAVVGIRVGNAVGIFVGLAVVGLVDGALVGLVVGDPDGALVGLKVGPAGPDISMPPPQVQQASLAVAPKFSQPLPKLAQLLPEEYQAQS